MDKENYEVLWQEVFLPEIENSVTSIVFESFIKLLKPIDVRGNTIILCTETKLIADTVMNENMGGKIRKAIAGTSFDHLSR